MRQQNEDLIKKILANVSKVFVVPEIEILGGRKHLQARRTFSYMLIEFVPEKVNEIAHFVGVAKSTIRSHHAFVKNLLLGMTSEGESYRNATEQLIDSLGLVNRVQRTSGGAHSIVLTKEQEEKRVLELVDPEEDCRRRRLSEFLKNDPFEKRVRIVVGRMADCPDNKQLFRELAEVHGRFVMKEAKRRLMALKALRGQRIGGEGEGDRWRRSTTR